MTHLLQAIRSLRGLPGARPPRPPAPGAALAGAVTLLAAALTGCAPTCAQNCRKLLFDCELDTQRVAFEECELSCSTQEALYQSWENQELVSLFREHRACIGGSTCEEIADGACYEGFEELFVFEPGSTAPDASPR